MGELQGEIGVVESCFRFCVILGYEGAIMNKLKEKETWLNQIK